MHACEAIIAAFPSHQARLVLLHTERCKATLNSPPTRQRTIEDSTLDACRQSPAKEISFKRPRQGVPSCRAMLHLGLCRSHLSKYIPLAASMNAIYMGFAGYAFSICSLSSFL